LDLFAYLKKIIHNARQRGESKKAAKVKEYDAELLTPEIGRSRAPVKAAIPKRHLTWQFYKGKATQESDLVIGFDLGTSCSKVVIQDKVLKKAWAVPFGDRGCQGNRYLLPTVLGIGRDNELTLDGGCPQIGALKTRFLQDTDLVCRITDDACMTSTECICAYIGLALMEIREWFWREKEKEYKARHINWELNIGMPARSYDNQGLYRRMKLLALGGWQLSLIDSTPLTPHMVTRALCAAEAQLRSNGCNEEKGELHPDLVVPIPEIIAQVIGYARSPLRKNGMYLMADIGASTLDVSTFILHENDGEDVYSILVAEVERLGAAILHNHRIQSAQKAIESVGAPEIIAKFRAELMGLSRSAFDGISPLPEIEPLFPKGCGEAIKQYRSLNKEFLVECSRVVRRVIGETMRRKNPLSDAWSRGLPVFLCGGGSKIETYRKLIPDVQERLRRTAFSGFIPSQIPKPTNLETDDIPPRDFHRMSVAYGLSFSSIDIGNIIPPAAIGDLVQNKAIRDLGDRFIDKDMV
jgi:hypothetical protein